MSTSTSSASAPGGQMTLMEHLTELRKRLIISVLALAVGMLIVTLFYNQLFDWLLEPYRQSQNDPDANLLQLDPLEGFGVRLKVTGYGGIALAMPVLLWQVWRFISPGLYDNEKRYAIPFVGSALLLFATGAGIAYWTMPKALDFLGSIGGDSLTQQYSPGKYFQLITYMMLAFGAGFEFPILLVFLQLAGVVQTDQLRQFRRYAIVLITVLVAVLTPSGDPYSMLALSVPMIIFYEVAILIGRWHARRAARTAS
jgi:sec-independent protein translocase protein TatC